MGRVWVWVWVGWVELRFMIPLDIKAGIRVKLSVKFNRVLDNNRMEGIISRMGITVDLNIHLPITLKVILKRLLQVKLNYLTHLNPNEIQPDRQIKR